MKRLYVVALIAGLCLSWGGSKLGQAQAVDEAYASSVPARVPGQE